MLKSCSEYNQQNCTISFKLETSYPLNAPTKGTRIECILLRKWCIFLQKFQAVDDWQTSVQFSCKRSNVSELKFKC